jgi:hypothetical protein
VFSLLNLEELWTAQYDEIVAITTARNEYAAFPCLSNTEVTDPKKMHLQNEAWIAVAVKSFVQPNHHPSTSTAVQSSAFPSISNENDNMGEVVEDMKKTAINLNVNYQVHCFSPLSKVAVCHSKTFATKITSMCFLQHQHFHRFGNNPSNMVQGIAIVTAEADIQILSFTKLSLHAAHTSALSSSSSSSSATSKLALVKPANMPKVQLQDPQEIPDDGDDDDIFQEKISLKQLLKKVTTANASTATTGNTISAALPQKVRLHFEQIESIFYNYLILSSFTIGMA